MLEAIPEEAWPGRIPVFVKIDIGYHRAGVAVGEAQLGDLAYALKGSSGRTRTAGFYAHMGHSYSVGDPQEALKFFSEELQGVEQGALEFLKIVGATPTTTATQNIVDNCAGSQEYRALLARVGQSFAVELHAGVYPVMDMQQLATRARPLHSASDPAKSLLSFRDLGLRALVEVVSVYNERAQPEAMIAAGSIALGREPCKSYPGWGVVTSWPEKDGEVYDPEGERKGWIVGRISQEHGVLSWEGPVEEVRRLEVGQKLMVWPNHACMCGPSFGWYLVVDSEEGAGETVVDVWTRWRGW
jgi:D-serine deaminase-like pyridoxal phosphate-dependent protein